MWLRIFPCLFRTAAFGEIERASFERLELASERAGAFGGDANAAMAVLDGFGGGDERLNGRFSIGAINRDVTVQPSQRKQPKDSVQQTRFEDEFRSDRSRTQ